MATGRAYLQLPLSILNTELKSWFKCMPHAQMQIWPSQKLSAVTYVVLPVGVQFMWSSDHEYPVHWHKHIPWKCTSSRLLAFTMAFGSGVCKVKYPNYATEWWGLGINSFRIVSTAWYGGQGEGLTDFGSVFHNWEAFVRRCSVNRVLNVWKGICCFVWKGHCVSKSKSFKLKMVLGMLMMN